MGVVIFVFITGPSSSTSCKLVKPLTSTMSGILIPVVVSIPPIAPGISTPSSLNVSIPCVDAAIFPIIFALGIPIAPNLFSSITSVSAPNPVPPAVPGLALNLESKSPTTLLLGATGSPIFTPRFASAILLLNEPKGLPRLSICFLDISFTSLTASIV